MTYTLETMGKQQQKKSRPVVSDSDDEKRIKQAEKAADCQCCHAGYIRCETWLHVSANIYNTSNMQFSHSQKSTVHVQHNKH